MSYTAIGHIVIGGVTLSTDPETYENYDWPKRWSKHEGMNGQATIQDFGHVARDLILRLVSGNQFLDEAVVTALDAAWRAKGTLYNLTDWLGNDFDVFIANFKPITTRLPGFYTYTMELHVWTITKLFGASFR